MHCWGTDPETGAPILKPEVVPTADGVEFVSVDLGLRFFCALSTDGIVFCKGAGYHGELGTGVDEIIMGGLTVPVKQNGVVFKSLSVGYYHACAIDISDDLYCWGDNEYGQLGVSGMESSNVPVKVGSKFRQVSSGGEHTCAVNLSDKGFCWGRNDMHQSSPQESYIIAEPTQIDGKWNAIYSGYDYTLGINSVGDGYGWGVSEGISSDSAAGGYLGQGRDFCLDFDTGEIVCKVESGSQGSGLLTFEQNPTQIKGNKKWLTFAPGRMPCGIEKGSRYLYCWGYTAGEAYAMGSPGTNTPKLVSKKAWEQVASGISGARCALSTRGEAYCWGRNLYDCGGICPLGNGGVENSALPLKVKSNGLWRASKGPASRSPEVNVSSTLEGNSLDIQPSVSPTEATTTSNSPVQTIVEGLDSEPPQAGDIRGLPDNQGLPVMVTMEPSVADPISTYSNAVILFLAMYILY